MNLRTIRKQYRALRDDIGELHTWRPLPNDEIEQIDPFLFLNHHGPQVYPPRNRGLPFGPHPHRGFETVTFIVEGSLTHRDTGGHESVIETGGVQWMTAGRGLEHEEVSPPEFLERGGPLEILQLWINLPSRLKFTEPRYVGLQKDEIASFDNGGVTVNLISGDWSGHRGPIASLTDVHMMTVVLTAGSRIVLPAPRGRNVFFYIVRGKLTIGEAFHLIDWNDDGDEIEVEAIGDALILFGHAKPYGEPVVAHGPFVMNTREEIVQAIRDYQAGKFGA
ncbi:MAG: quercetin 2,3-dioxygenase [Thermoanaerobaculia bacterium]|jgi:redox-sensitive bicupin YhaK (pirin superfamily)|nr:quercetin 2,3-dioxygenase [Thermoanaerobaculia bacterium]MEA2415028.1 quercetin 2,3-dioxygenase [Thermoanaerobaculia bacterium]